MDTSADDDGALAQARAAVLASIEDRPGGAVAPSMRPLTLNTATLLYPPSAPLAAKLEARVQAGYELEGQDYPTSSTWARVVWPAIGVGTLDIPVVIGSGIAALFHVYLTGLIFLLSLIVLVVSGVVAIAASRRPMRDPLRIATAERRELNQARSWQSSQPWAGPRSSTREYRLMQVAHQTIQRLAASPAWASRYLDEHRLRLNLAAELDAIDAQACQLATLEVSRSGDRALSDAWSALVDRVARLRHYGDGVTAMDEHVLALEGQSQAVALDTQVAALAAGSAMDEFAAEHVRSLSADLHKLATTSFATSRENAT